MTPFELVALLLALTALVAFANARWLGLPTVIGVALGGLLLSLLLVAGGALGISYVGPDFAAGILEQIGLGEILLGGFLGVFLFAGALEIDLNDLRENRWSIVLLATVGVLVSTFVVGTGTWAALAALGVEIPWAHALLFGALISPTDPISVLAILRRVSAPKDLEVMISGEALFNDGVGVVVFLVILGIVTGGEEATLGHVATLFAQEAVGGIAFGLVLGYVAFLLLREIDQHTAEILITLAVVTGGYALAARLHTSGPLAMVVAGLLIGNQGRALAMSADTRERLDTFWVLVDEILNALLFLLIGLEVLVLEFRWDFVLAGLVAIPLVLGARFLAVSGSISLLRLRRRYRPYTIRIMTWGGLKGGIAIALALSVPAAASRDLILFLTYAVVVFSLLVQGLTVEPLARKVAEEAEGRPPPEVPAGEEEPGGR